MKKKLLFALFLVAMVIAVFTGCKQDDDDDDDDNTTEKTYTVYTGYGHYSTWEEYFFALSDGYYDYIEITEEERDSYFDLTTFSKHNWTQSDISSWFIARNYSNDQATQLTEWITTSVSHGFVVDRDGDYVYLMIK